MKTLGLSSNTNDSFSAYLNVIREKISQLTANSEFVGHINFKVNILHGEIKNIQIGNEESLKF